MSDSLWPHGLHHARLPCPSLSPEVCSSPCPLSQWCHPIISSSVTPFSCPQSFPASESLPMNWLFPSGGQSIGASASVLSMNIHGWFPLGFTGLGTISSGSIHPVHSFVNSLVAQSCSALCDPMDCNMPDFPVHNQLPELAQTHVHRVSDVIQPSHPLLSPSPTAFKFCQHQDIFKWVSSSH